jgi:8-oxo-dGTP pyrophosphatase MutT (NUDIX family)
MYKVFIDNKVIIFTENWKKSNKTLDFVMVEVSLPDRLDLVKCRNELPIDILLVVKVKNPESAIRSVFATYDFVQAAGGIVKRKNKHLFIERLGVWDLPKGKMEDNEIPEETAIREIEEECGIEKPVIRGLIGVTFHTYEYKGKPTLKKNWWYALDYNGPKELVPQTEEAITQAVWLTKKEWSTVRENTYASIAEVLDLAAKALR